MNREILFRGKSRDSGKWLFGDYMRYAGGAQIWTHDADGGTWNAIVDPATVGQYTGLTDRSGKKVFEGDIVRTKKFGRIIGHANVNDFDVFKVQYEPCVFRLVNKNRGFNLVDNGFSKFEVAGNVHDNPELL